MSKEVTTPKTTPKTGYSYRNIKKTFNKSANYGYMSKQYHLELGDHNNAVVVPDRDRDWLELANKDVDKVGLANVLELARKRGVDLSTFAFKDSEAIDTSGINPMDPNSLAHVNADLQSSADKLQALAKQLGCTPDDLVEAVVKGGLDKFIAERTVTTEVKEEVKENA